MKRNKSQSSAQVAGWHPDFRVMAALPDNKVVRTDFVINGIALGSLIAIIAWVWQGNGWLGLVVGLALALNTVLAVSIGGTVPIILKALKVDPAVASGPILTTITDMCGFFLLLGTASLMLPLLTGV